MIYEDNSVYGYDYQPPNTGFNPGVGSFLNSANTALKIYQLLSSFGSIEKMDINQFDYTFTQSTAYTQASAKKQADMMRNNAKAWYKINSGKLENWYKDAMFQYGVEKRKTVEAMGKVALVTGVSGLGGSPVTAYQDLVRQVNAQLTEAKNKIETTKTTTETELEEKLNEVIGTEEQPGAADIVQETGEEKARLDAINNYENIIKDYSTYKHGDANNSLEAIWKDTAEKRLIKGADDFMTKVSNDASLTDEDKIKLISEYLYVSDKATTAVHDSGIFGWGLPGVFRNTLAELFGQKETTMDSFTRLAKDILRRYKK